MIAMIMGLAQKSEEKTEVQAAKSSDCTSVFCYNVGVNRNNIDTYYRTSARYGVEASYLALAVVRLLPQLPQSASLTVPSGREPSKSPYPQIKAQRSGFDLDKEEGSDGYAAWGESHKRNAVGFF